VVPSELVNGTRIIRKTQFSLFLSDKVALSRQDIDSIMAYYSSQQVPDSIDYHLIMNDLEKLKQQ